MKTRDKNNPGTTGKRRVGGRGFFSSIYYALNSIKLAVFLFIILGLVSIIGTIIEQGGDPAEYAKRYSEGTIRIFKALGLFDMYHSAWFFTLLILLILNLIVCTIERLPKVWRFAHRIKPILDEGDEKRYPFYETLDVPAGAERVERELKRLTKIPFWILLLDIAALFLAAFFIHTYQLNFMEILSFIICPLLYVLLLNLRGKVVRTEKNGVTHLFVNQWLLSRFGVYVTHVSILLIFLGAMIGNLFGFKGYMAIGEGQTINRMFVRQDKWIDTIATAMAKMFSSNSRDQSDHERHQQFKTLPFAIRCDDFSISYYPNSGRPKDYTSDLVVVRNGQDSLRKTIQVNDPLVVDKIYFYQSNYGKTGQPGKVVLQVEAPGQPPKEYRAPVNGSFRIDGTDTEIKIISFVPDFTVSDGRIIPRSEEMINPAVYILAKNKGKELFSGWIFANYPQYSVKTGNYHFKFKDYWGWQYTGLQVAYDPGVDVVWLGCSLMVIGLLISFFHSHRRIWARVQEKKVVLAGTAHKNRTAFETQMNQLVKLLKE